MSELLDRIDATVDGLCACGCGQPLDPSGPSGWWASEACQTRWQRRRVRPDDARLADDAPCPQCVGRCEPGCGCTCWGITTEEASEAFVEFDRRLREAIEAQEGERAVLAGEPDPRARDLPWRLNPLAAVSAPTREDPQGWYWCATCRQTGEPELDRDDDISLFSFRATRVRPPRYACPHCHATVPRDLRLTVQQDDDGDQLLRVERGGHQAEHHLSAWYLREADDPEALILRTWVQLQRDVVAPVAREEPAQRVWTIVDDPAQAEVVTVDPGNPTAGVLLWMANPPTDPEAPTMAELADGADLSPYLATTRDAFRRVGERLLGEGGPIAGAIAAYQNLPEATRAAVEAEQDRLALRALCSDEAEYERALQAARDHGLTVREVSEMLAAGQALGPAATGGGS